MKATLALEAIGYEAARRMRKSLVQGNDPRKWAAKTLVRNGGKLPQPWVAELIAVRESRGLERHFVRPARDFAQANGSGNRGIRFFFVLESGKVYEVQELTSWTNKRRYFCRVTTIGDIEEITEGEIRQWALAQIERRVSGSTFSTPPREELAESLQTFLASIYRSPGAKTRP